jgi:phosphoribosylcarboxyaminoimidazole (NCAIR) mutase
MGVGKSGATNAAIFAVEILALGDQQLQRKLIDYKDQLEKAVAEKSRKLLESM